MNHPTTNHEEHTMHINDVSNSTATIYYEHEQAPWPWAVAEDGGVSDRFETYRAAVGYCEAHGLNYVVDSALDNIGPTFTFTVTVTAATPAQAAQVMAERLGAEEDYGFPYGIDWEGK